MPLTTPDPLAWDCPVCAAPPNVQCLFLIGDTKQYRNHPHPERVALAQERAVLVDDGTAAVVPAEALEPRSLRAADPRLSWACPTCGSLPGVRCFNTHPDGFNEYRVEPHHSRINMSLTADPEQVVVGDVPTSHVHPNPAYIKPPADPVVELLTEIRDLLLIQIAQDGSLGPTIGRQVGDAVMRQDARS